MQSDEKQDSELGNPLIDTLADRLVTQALRDTPIEEIFEITCRQLYATGIPIQRAHVTFKVLHPLFNAQSLTWYRDKSVERGNFLHGVSPEKWLNSPLYHMVVNKLPFLRRRLTGDDAILDFELLEELNREGSTDYLGFMIPFGESSTDDKEKLVRGAGIVGSWATDRTNGFTNSDIRALTRIEQRLAVAFKINIQAMITQNILAAYLGPGAGNQVLNGNIKRGDGEIIHSVIWYSDMRNSTRLADSMSGQDFMQALNSYFEATAGAVLQNGGEVLRFIGDAVLAIFPIRSKRQTANACRLAMQAVTAAQQNIKIANKQRAEHGYEQLDFGLGLHVGEVLFGNIGVPERVEFSVIGPAANEVARLESLTKKLKRQILVSETFARNMDLNWIDAGQHKIRGVGKLVSVFAPPTA